jgi:hypothetical protein
MLRLYACGPEADILQTFETDHIRAHVLGPELGAASALRMCYEAFGEGIATIAVEILVAAERFGVGMPLRSELLETHGTGFEWVLRSVPGLMPRAQRTVKEMEEAALALESAGLSPRPLMGIAEVLRWLADTFVPKSNGRPSGESVRNLIERLGKA